MLRNTTAAGVAGNQQRLRVCAVQEGELAPELGLTLPSCPAPRGKPAFLPSGPVGPCCPPRCASSTLLWVPKSTGAQVSSYTNGRVFVHGYPQSSRVREIVSGSITLPQAPLIVVLVCSPGNHNREEVCVQEPCFLMFFITVDSTHRRGGPAVVGYKTVMTPVSACRC